MTKTDVPCHSRCGTLKNPHRLVAMTAEHRSKFAALHWQWCRIHISEKFSSGTKNHRQTNKHDFKLGGIRRDVHLNKLDSPSPKDALCQVWLKLAQLFWRRRFFYFVNSFSLFLYYLPWKRAGHFILTNCNSLFPRMHCAKFG